MFPRRTLAALASCCGCPSFTDRKRAQGGHHSPEAAQSVSITRGNSVPLSLCRILGLEAWVLGAI